MEGISNEWFDPEQDPRATLAGCLRNFFLQAVRQQRVIDAQPGPKPAGSLYKTDKNFLKIKLEVPAPDRVFGDSESGVELRADNSRPSLWVLLPLGAGPKGEDFDLIDVVVAADDITVHVIPPSETPTQFLVKDNYVGPKSPLYETLEELQSHQPPDEIDQVNAALYWTEALNEYDIRTITSSQRATA